MLESPPESVRAALSLGSLDRLWLWMALAVDRLPTGCQVQMVQCKTLQSSHVLTHADSDTDCLESWNHLYCNLGRVPHILPHRTKKISRMFKMVGKNGHF